MYDKCSLFSKKKYEKFDYSSNSSYFCGVKLENGHNLTIPLTHLVRVIL